eukprot:14913-Heterococcus_DN1.PRE.2
MIPCNSVPFGADAIGCTITPAGLSTAIKCSSSKSTFKCMSSGVSICDAEDVAVADTDSTCPARTRTSLQATK